MTRILPPAMLAVALLGAGAALAGDNECRSPMSQWQSQDAAVEHARALGIEVRRLKIDDGCYEIKGRDSDGNEVDMKLDPATLALRKLEVAFRAGSDPSHYLPGANGAVPVQREAPENNPLLKQGSQPKAKEN